MSDNLRTIPVVLLLNLMVLFAGQLCTAQDPPGNEQIIEEQLAAGVLHKIQELVPSGSNIILPINRSDHLSRWLIAKLTQACLEANYIVYSRPDSSIKGYQVELSDIATGIVYKPGERGWNRRVKQFSRTVTSGLGLAISSPQGRVLTAGGVNGANADRLSRNSLETVENPALPFTRGTFEDSGIIKRWLEPIAATAATMTVILLFYTLRSN